MGTTFRPYSPSQMLLLPPDLGEWLPEGHLAYHVSDIADALDLRAFVRGIAPRPGKTLWRSCNPLSYLRLPDCAMQS